MTFRRVRRRRRTRARDETARVGTARARERVATNPYFILLVPSSCVLDDDDAIDRSIDRSID